MRPLRVVVTGSESTGKTTLARSLAEHYRAPWSPEFAREYLQRKVVPLTEEDVEPIALGQREGEDRALEGADRLVFFDTDLVSTALYARHYYGACPPWVEASARARLADLYLLCHPDVPWTPDGLQRDRGHLRVEMHALFVEALESLGARVAPIQGPWPTRLPQALAALTPHLRGSFARPRFLRASDPS
jgi:NadR type nicotinamide-nucleotide adenylyltransferase